MQEEDSAVVYCEAVVEKKKQANMKFLSDYWQ
jgi:hypothetical protein